MINPRIKELEKLLDTQFPFSKILMKNIWSNYKDKYSLGQIRLAVDLHNNKQ